MQQTYAAVVKHTGDWWIGWIEEVPGVNCQEASREELVETLRATLAEAIALNRQEARSAAGKAFEVLPIAVSRVSNFLSRVARRRLDAALGELRFRSPICLAQGH